MDTTEDFCRICHSHFRESGWGRQSMTFGFCCTRCVNKACRVVRRHNKRARLAGVIGKIFAFDWLSLLFASEFRCSSCKEEKELTLDHIRPLSQGGQNLRWNIQPLCQGCHGKKDNIRKRT